MKKLKIDGTVDKHEFIKDCICKEYAISRDEFDSRFKYGILPEARYLYCLILQSLGNKNKDIAEITGFSKARVSISIDRAEVYMNSLPYFKQKHDAIVNLLKT
jgi:hypothetical protein